MVLRPLKLNRHSPILPRRIQELEAKDVRGADFVIQHTLPSMMEFNGHFKKNIAMYCSETSNFIASGWAEKLNLMDVAWVPSRQMINAARASHVTIPIKKIPYACDTTKFERSYKAVPLEGDNEAFTFYTIMEMGKRKNLMALLRAFHTEFSPDEPVRLVIKSHKHGMDPGECKKHIIADCTTIKTWLKLHPRIEDYKQEVIITDLYADESLYRLHATCDCFVLPSYGEAWGLPAFDAMGFGKTPIVTNWGGFREFISDDTGWLVSCTEEQVFGITDNLEDLYTGNESWAAVDIRHLRKCMREAYTNEELRRNKAEAGINAVYDFSYNLVGSLIKKELESYVNEAPLQREGN